MHTETCSDWLILRVATLIVFMHLLGEQTELGATKITSSELYYHASFRVILLKRSKNVITIEVVTFKFGNLKILLYNFEQLSPN